MSHKLECILHVLNAIDTQTEENIFEKDEIQDELKEIDDHPELLHTIHHSIILLQNEEIHNAHKIWKTAFKIDWTLGSCINNIGLVRDKVVKAREYYTKRKVRKCNVRVSFYRKHHNIVSNNKETMIYELREIIQAFKKMDIKLQRDTYAQEDIRKKYEDIHEIAQLLVAIERYAAVLENADVNDIDTMLGYLADLDATLNTCINNMYAIQEFIRQFLIQFSEDEITD